MNATITPRKKSEVLTRQELADFRKWVKKRHTKQDARQELEVNIKTLDMVLLKGSASPDTIAKIRNVIAKPVNHG